MKRSNKIIIALVVIITAMTLLEIKEKKAVKNKFNIFNPDQFYGKYVLNKPTHKQKWVENVLNPSKRLTNDRY